MQDANIVVTVSPFERALRAAFVRCKTSHTIPIDFIVAMPSCNHVRPHLWEHGISHEMTLTVPLILR